MGEAQRTIGSSLPLDIKIVITLKTEFVLGRDSKTPTSLPKNIAISVPGSSATPSTSKKLVFVSAFFLL